MLLRSRPLLVLAIGAVLGCAAPRPRPAVAPAPAGTPARPPSEVKFEEPLVVEAHPADLDLAGKNDEELFAIGSAAFAAKDFGRAAAAFARGADLFPDSKRHATALFNAGLSYLRQREWRLALERFRAFERDYTGPDAIEAAFFAAECDYNLGDLPSARARLDRLAARPDLDPADRMRAVTKRGIVELESKDPEAAEKSLRQAVALYEGAKESERIDEYAAGEAQYYLGEVYRTHFDAIRLDPASASQEQLGRELENKAQMLLTAQGHYLRAIRIGNPQAAVASGYRIGGLYDALYRELTEAPLPPGLDEEEQSAYREVLRERVRVLVSKAIGTYERTLALAERGGVESQFVERTQASLERMKHALEEAPAAPDVRQP